MKNVLAFIFSFLLVINCFGQTEAELVTQEDAYTKTINGRAEKIVATLGITDSEKASRVRSIIAGHYRNLNAIHTDRDTQIKAAKTKGEDKAAADAAINKMQEEAAAKIKKVHLAFIASLSTELSGDQITKVKDGLTYNVTNITYAGYLDMLPNLTEVQKNQIRTWLEEAREYAMNAESAEKKHAWFGKYKGRINNYLSAAGYDLKKESEAWRLRLKAKEEEKK